MAIAASVMMASCGKGEGNAAANDSDSVKVEAAEALPTEVAIELKGVSGGEWDNFRPELGVAKLTVVGEEGDMANVEVVAPFMAPQARAVKGVASAKYQLYYADEKFNNINCEKSTSTRLKFLQLWNL